MAWKISKSAGGHVSGVKHDGLPRYNGRLEAEIRLKGI